MPIEKVIINVGIGYSFLPLPPRALETLARSSSLDNHARCRRHHVHVRVHVSPSGGHPVLYFGPACRLDYGPIGAE